MKVIRILFLSLTFLFFSLLIFAFFLPKKIVIEEEIVIDKSAEIIFPHFNDLDKWVQWSVWNEDYYQKAVNYRQAFVYPSNFYHSNSETNLSFLHATKSLVAESNKIVDSLLITEIVERVSNSSLKIVVKAFAEEEKRNHATLNIHLHQSSSTSSSNPAISTTVRWSFSNTYHGYRKNLFDRYWIWFYSKGLRRAYRDSLHSLKVYLEKRK